MMKISKTGAWMLLGTSALVMIPLAEAEARAPRKPSFVQKTQAAALGAATFDDDGATIVAGINVCRTQLAADARVKFSFTTSYASADTGAEQFFDGPFAFEQNRGASARIDCLAEGVECEDLGTDALTLSNGVAEVEVPLRDLVGFSTPDLCESEGTDLEHFVQLHIFPDTSNLNDPSDYVEGRVVMDLIRPEAPVVESGVSTSSRMRLNLETSTASDVRGHFAVVRNESFEGGQLHTAFGSDINLRPIEINESSGEGTVNVELEEGSVVHVGVVAQDHASNYSVLSSSVEVEVLRTNDFWDYYVDAGGSETGGYGCTSAGGGSTGLLALVVGALVLGVGRTRRTRKLLSTPSA